MKITYDDDEQQKHALYYDVHGQMNIDDDENEMDDDDDEMIDDVFVLEKDFEENDEH
jgi:hypothetical protein